MYWCKSVVFPTLPSAPPAAGQNSTQDVRHHAAPFTRENLVQNGTGGGMAPPVEWDRQPVRGSMLGWKCWEHSSRVNMAVGHVYLLLPRIMTLRFAAHEYPGCESSSKTVIRRAALLICQRRVCCPTCERRAIPTRTVPT